MKAYLKKTFPMLVKIYNKFRSPTGPIPLGLWIINVIIQRVFRINGNVPWMVHYTSTVTEYRKIILGKDVWKSFAISGNCYIQGGNGILFGEGTIFAPGCKIISANHNPNNLSEHISENPIVIGKFCWIGANAIILPGVSLGDHCVVGAGAVVTHCFPEGSVIVGVPAKSVNNE